ncbi:MAG: histidine--tRNA ligase [Nannocystaceae bacterium]|nr:histidine--tRNA ligase [bacterium]
MGSKAKMSGFPEWLPEQELVQARVLQILREQFGLHGFTPLHLRSVEPVEVLTSKGEDADKEIYGVQRLAAEPGTAAKLGLHFDLTVPMARYVMQNRGSLVFPFRRYQIAPCWRGERPQMGRYREFIQADIDIIGEGSLDPMYDAEMVWLLAHVMKALPIPAVQLYVNNRKLLEGLYRGFGIEDITTALRIVDKLDKIGADKTIELMVEAGIATATAQRCIEVANIEAQDASLRETIGAFGVSNDLVEEGLRELVAVLEYGHGGGVTAALRIARGLDYYTGTVVEGVLESHPKAGSVCSGGRYDNLAGDGKVKLPGMGVSVGVTRIMALCFHHGLLEASPKKTTADVLVIVHDDESVSQSHAVARQLRERGVACVVSHRASAYGKQIQWAEKVGIEYVWFPPRKGGEHEVKNIRSGEQAAADPSAWTPR